MASPLLLIVACGLLAGAGVAVISLASIPHHVRLGDAIAHLDGSSALSAAPDQRLRLLDGSPGALDRVGAWGYQRLRLPLSSQTRLMLTLRGRSIGDFFAEKFVWMIAGFSAPAVYALSSLLAGASVSALPIGLSLVGGIAGYFVPNVRLRRSSATAKSGAAESLFMLFDLVVLERLANRSVTQALSAAAGVSDTTVFLRVRAALERARLEQVAPWQELRRASNELELPMLADMADVLKLDEQGAALAGPLRARVRDLRDAQLTRSKQAAQEHTERMTLWMTLPVVIFGLIFLTPPLLMMVQTP